MAGLFSSGTLEQIRAASDIVDVIGSYIPLKRAGANFVALCPFHKEKTPSFNVNPHRQIFHCFGCHKGGDVFAFVKEYENIDFPEAVRRLADRAKIPLEYEKNPAEQQSRHLKERLLQIHEQIAQRWQNALANEASGQIARDYLAKRGVTEEAVKLFRLGSAPDLWDDTVNWAKSKGHELALVEQAGLILRKQDGTSYYDRFRGRLMFPICDEQGRVIAFSGRVLSGDEKIAKYVNSPETPIFTKGKVLFGLDKAKRSILDVGCAVICEGQLDTISCHARGITHVVAPQGTALTAQHVQILQRYTNDIILCFDGDNAGRKAAAKGFDELIQLGVPFRVAEIPPPEDPDSFIKKAGVKAFFELLVGARDFFDWYLDYLCHAHDPKSDRGRIAVIAAMARVLNGRNLVLVDTYTQRTAMRLAVSSEAVRAEFKRTFRAKTPAPAAKDEPTPEGSLSAPPSAPEYWLLKLLLLHDDLTDWTAKHFDLNWIEHPLVKQIVAQRLAAHANQTWTSLAAFLDECETPEMRSLVTEATAQRRPIPNPLQQMSDVTLRLRNQLIDRQSAALMQRANQPECSEAERLDLLHQQQELRQLKRQPIEGGPTSPLDQSKRG
jgi:DNA primase